MAESSRSTSDIRVLSCPNCTRLIKPSIRACPFCRTIIHAEAAEETAAMETAATVEAVAPEMAKLNQAVRGARHLTITFGVLIGLMALEFVPPMGFISALSFYLFIVAVPFLVIRWWLKFGSLHTDDPRFRRAKRSAILVSIVTGTIILFLMLAIVLVLTGHH